MSTRDERNSLASTQTDDLLHLIRRSRQYDDGWLLSNIGQGVAFVRQQFQGSRTMPPLPQMVSSSCRKRSSIVAVTAGSLLLSLSLWRDRPVAPRSLGPRRGALRVPGLVLR